MNVFGAFTFGSLIKTFIPGFVWLVALIVLDAGIELWAGIQDASLWSYVRNKDQSTMVLGIAIPASILLGLLSNVLVFMGLNDWLVRSPVNAAERDLYSLYATLAQRVRDRYWDALQGIDTALQAPFDKHIDPELLLLHAVGTDKIAYVREQYWYHLEFQLNLVLSLGATAVAVVVWILLRVPQPKALWLVAICVLVAYAVMRWLVKAARKNYARHLGKIATIMAAALYRPPPEEPQV